MLCLVAVAVSSVPAGLRQPAANYRTAPVPAWTDTVALPDTANDTARDARDGILDLVEDNQMRVTSSSVERYYRHVAKVLSAAGLEQASQLQIEFDPSEESLVLHYVRITRGSQTIDAFDPSEVQIIQPERELDDRIYSGALEALVFLRDVRPGDVVDYAYSLDTRGEGFGGRFADTLVLGEDYPVRRIRWRLLWPEGRKLFFRAQNVDLSPRATTANGEVEYVWERERAPAVDVEDDAPAWFDPTPVVQVGEFETWGDVVAWALPLYKAPDALPSDLARQVDAWRSENARPEDRLVAAARFVQDEIRYTGIELGPSSFVPASPETVFRRRFGDCKDKSLLLATVLRAMGIEADPALVSLDAGRVVPDWLPSPLAFDHCIVRAAIDGKTYWIDPTIMLQRGGLVARRNPDYGHALVLRAGTTGLEAIGADRGEGPTTVVSEVYTLEGDDAARLETVSTYTGPDADDVRYALAETSIEDFGKDGLDYYGGDFASIEADGLPEVEDDEAANRIRITERYRITGFWEDGTRTLSADRIEDLLSSARVARRSGPLAIDYPVDVSETIEIRAQKPIAVSEESVTIGDEAVSFTYQVTNDEGAVRIGYRYRALTDFVPASRVMQHRETMKKMRKRLDYTLRRDAVGASRTATLAAVGGPALLLVGLGAIAAFLLRRRSAFSSDRRESV